MLPPPPGTPLPESRFRLDTASLTVRVPTMVIWGERDRALLPTNLDGLDQFVRNLTVHRIPEANHWVVHQKPELVNGYIREFLVLTGSFARKAQAMMVVWVKKIQPRKRSCVLLVTDQSYLDRLFWYGRCGT